MAHVVDEILDLLLGERPRAPIADRLRLAQRDAAQIAHQIEQRDRQAVSDERRSDLRVERSRAAARVRVGENAQIGRERVADDARAGERVDQRPQIGQREWIDQRHAVLEEQLHDHEVWRVRLLGMELGVEPTRDERAMRSQVSASVSGVSASVTA